MESRESYVATPLAPTLTPALAELCRTRPADPITALAESLLAHKPSPPVAPPAKVPASLPSAAEILARIHGRQASATSVVTAALARIALHDKDVNACPVVLGELALRQAAAVDANIAAGAPLRPLEGLPFLIKLNVDGPVGSVTTASTPALADWVPTVAAPIVEKLMAAGAIPLAKTNMPELAFGFRCLSPVHGECFNPHNTAVGPGASSTGTAVAIACGYAPCGIGTDTAGSLRIPAYCNGVVGMRPSRGRWPTEGVVPISEQRDTPGPMGSCVADLCLMDAAVTGTSVVQPSELRGKRVCVPRDMIGENGTVLAPHVAAGLEHALSALRTAGCVVEEIDGFLDVAMTAKETFAGPPFMCTPYEDARKDLQAYCDHHRGKGLPEALHDAGAIIEQLGNAGLKPFFAPKEGTPDEIAAKHAAAAAGNARTEEAYRAFFARHSLAAVIMPTMPNEPTATGSPVPAYFGNESAYTPKLCAVRYPSLALPTPPKGPAGTPSGVFLYGLEDRSLLSLGLSLETAMKAVDLS